jgi:cysteine desulfurase
LRPEALDAMLPWLTDRFGNADTLYQEGKQARQALEDARATLARHIGASPTEVVFTSGGTEANNALIAGIVRAVRTGRGREKGGNHLVAGAFEHHAVLEPVQALRREGYETSLVRPTRDGFVTPTALAAALRPDTVLASVMLAQNEVGTVQPIASLGRLAHGNGTLLHTDAVQALGKCALDVGALGVDAASFSAHKIGGPAGVGAFFLKRQTPFASMQLGGGQEGGRRSGTPDVAGAVGFARALELAEAEHAQESVRLAALRDHLAASLLALDERISLTVPLDGGTQRDEDGAAGGGAGGGPVGAAGGANDRGVAAAVAAAGGGAAHGAAGGGAAPGTPAAAHLPGMLSILVAGFESETLLLRLDRAGFALSGGSACSTGSLDPSHVLLSLGIPRNKAQGVLRISLGHGNTREQADAFVSALAAALR